jgi:hypothetical protein
MGMNGLLFREGNMWVHKYLIMKEGKCISLILSKFPRVFIFKEEAPRWPKKYVLEIMNRHVSINLTLFIS